MNDLKPPDYIDCPECGHNHGMVCPAPCVCTYQIQLYSRKLLREDELNAREDALAAIAKQYAGAKEATFFATAGALDGWDAAIKWMKGESK
jgi:hypothetical protein